MIERVLYRISVGVLSVAVIVLVIFVYWAIQPGSVLIVNNNPIPVEKQQVKGGDAQIVNIDYCKSSSTPGNVSWELVSDKVVVDLPSYVDTLPRGCSQDLKAALVLPFISTTDRYHFHWSVTYPVNPLKRSTVQFDSQPFTIMGGRKS